MKYLLILLVCLCGCSSVGKGNVQGDAEKLYWELKGNQKMRTEFYEGGQVKSIEIDTKGEPLIKLGDIVPTLEQ